MRAAILALSAVPFSMSCLVPPIPPPARAAPSNEAPNNAPTAVQTPERIVQPSAVKVPGFKITPDCVSPTDRDEPERHERERGRKDGQATHGRLPPEEIQRIVRERYLVFRKCYEAGLSRNRTLEGAVATRFVIGRSGSVSEVKLECTSMPDEAAVGCILDGFSSLTFPNPEGGIVTVVYPIRFTPGD